MTFPETLRSGLLYAAVLVPLSLFCLLVGFVGIGLLGDDFCGGHAPADAGGWSGPAVAGVPPAFVCTYRTADRGTVVLRFHRDVTVALVLWYAGTTVTLGAAIVALGRLRARWRASRGPA